MRIALFTPYSPEIGGGSVQLQSHVAQMPELSVEWYYLSAAGVGGDHRHWLGKPLSSAQFAADLSARSGFLPGSTGPAREIASRMNADLYWVVAHYEGISVAAELLAMGKPVHLTVHDEPLAMLIRSRRFRPLWPLMSLTFSRVLRSARSVDVTSTNMRDFFRRKYGVNCFALYKYLSELPEMNFHLSEKMVTVGHIGSLYHPDPFRKFVLACLSYATEQNRSLKIVRIGGSPEMDKIAGENLTTFENHGELLETDALPVLANCDFVYAMYPNGWRFRGFRRTSLPIKLSTYIQAQRPIFAHTPGDTGLAQLIEKYGVGTVCSSQSTDAIQQAIQAMLEVKIARSHFEALRSDLMGPNQLLLLRNALTGKDQV
jgi:hypothetical protein